jgi:hypothetical protein
MSRRYAATVLAFGLAMVGSGAQASLSPRVAACSWDRPGHNPFMGDVVAAVDRYADIPADVRQKLRQRMAERRYDDLVTIRRDSIDGGHEYSPAIREMHFGEGSVCGQISRSGWSAEMRERGLVYCESGHCILVPTVCRNVSRIERLPPRRVAEDKPPAGGGRGGGHGSGELLFEPPAAGGSNPPSFADGVAPPQTGLGEGGTPMAGSAAAWPGWSDPPLWAGPVGPGPGFNDVFGGHGPVGGLPPVIVPPPLPQLPPGGDGGGSVPPPLPLTPVPEPQTWALMAAGLALVGAAVRRRRRA